MRDVQKAIGLLADSDATVLLLGETGTGKEVVAHAIHQHGKRAKSPFVPVNCAAIPVELLESLLFGHVRGAFTGAVTDRTGSFREAQGGTLFLDETRHEYLRRQPCAGGRTAGDPPAASLPKTHSLRVGRVPEWDGRGC